MQHQTILPGPLICKPLHYRDKLDKFDSGAAQKIIDPQRFARALAVHAGQRVVLHIMLLQRLQRAHYQLMRRAPAFGHAILVVDLRRAIKRQTNQEMMTRKKLTPFIVQQDAVGLKAVANPPSGPVFLLQSNRPTIKIQPHQGWLSPLPGEGDLILRFNGGNIVTDISLQRRIIHA